MSGRTFVCTEEPIQSGHLTLDLIMYKEDTIYKILRRPGRGEK